MLSEFFHKRSPNKSAINRREILFTMKDMLKWYDSHDTFEEETERQIEQEITAQFNERFNHDGVDLDYARQCIHHFQDLATYILNKQLFFEKKECIYDQIFSAGIGLSFDNIIRLASDNYEIKTESYRLLSFWSRCPELSDFLETFIDTNVPDMSPSEFVKFNKKQCQLIMDYVNVFYTTTSKVPIHEPLEKH